MGGARRRRRLLAGAITLPVVLLAAAWLSVVYATGRPGEDRPPATLLTPTAERTYSTAPESEVRDVHEALHDLGDSCAEGDARSPAAIERHVSVILDFAQRHPNARFEIDDESGTSLALLLVLQDELRPCAPSLLPRVQELLPPEQRRPVGPAS